MPIRAKKAQVPPPDKPTCRAHAREMVFMPGTLRWECPEPDCGMVAYPKEDDSGRPITGKGEVELLVFKDEYGEEHLYVRAVGNNVIVEITEATTDWKTDGSTAVVGLTFDRVTQIDNYGRKRGKK